MRKPFLTTMVLLTVGMFAACADQPTSVEETTLRMTEMLNSTENLEVADGAALAIASAFNDLQFQARVRDALKSSEWVEHKVELSDLLATPTGSTLLERTASQTGLVLEHLRATLTGLPALDFYVPIREQRLAWSPGDPVAVGFAPSEDDADVYAFLPSGRQVYLTRESIDQTPYTLFLLHPAEPKSRRFESSIPREGPHIQEAAEYDFGGYLYVDGEYRDIADLPVGSRPPVQIRFAPATAIAGIRDFDYGMSERESGAGIGADKTPGTMLNWDQPFESDGWGACEVYSRQEIFNSIGVRLEKTRWPSSGSYGGLPCDDFGTYIWDWMTNNQFGIKVLNNGYANGGYYVNRRVLEDDAFNDDDWGVRRYEIPGWPEPSPDCYYNDPYTSAYPYSDGYCAETDTGGNWRGAIWSYAWSG